MLHKILSLCEIAHGPVLLHTPALVEAIHPPYLMKKEQVSEGLHLMSPSESNKDCEYRWIRRAVVEQLPSTEKVVIQSPTPPVTHYLGLCCHVVFEQDTKH